MQLVGKVTVILAIGFMLATPTLKLTTALVASGPSLSGGWPVSERHSQLHQPQCKISSGSSVGQARFPDQSNPTKTQTGSLSKGTPALCFGFPLWKGWCRLEDSNLRPHHYDWTGREAPRKRRCSPASEFVLGGIKPPRPFPSHSYGQNGHQFPLAD